MTTRPNPLTAPEPRRAAARAMLKAVGFNDADLEKPLIGVANTWIEIGPCNYHLRDLAVHVKEGIRAAGGTPMEFNTISISDGITMNTEGMKTSLVSREVMADSIELVARGNGFDGLIVLVGCDKTIPAGAMALARLNVPGLVLYGGSIAPGQWHGKDVTIQDVFEAVGAQAAGKMTLQDLRSLESAACPGAGACGGQFTANTMATAVEFLGIAALGSGSVPATHPGKAAVARAAGERVMDLVKSGLKPRDIMTRAAIENAIVSVAATGGSTNAVLHLLAIAREAGVELSLADFDRISAKTPVYVDLKPSGRFVANDLFAAGGISLVAQRLSNAKLLDPSAKTVTGKTHRRRSRAGKRNAGAGGRAPGRQADQADRRPDDPLRQSRARRLGVQGRGQRAPAPPRAGARVRQRGSGVRRGAEPVDQAERRGRHPLRRTERRAGDARDALGDVGDRRAGPRRQGRAHHRRALLRREPRLHRRATSRPKRRTAGRSRSCTTATSSCSTRTSASSRWSSARGTAEAEGAVDGAEAALHVGRDGEVRTPGFIRVSRRGHRVLRFIWR